MDSNNNTTKELDIAAAATVVLRKYLMRCFSEVAREYPAVSAMSPQAGADHIIALRASKKIEVTLYPVGELIKCKIQDMPISQNSESRA